MPEMQIVAEKECYRLVGDGRGRFAVLEVRADRVYSLDPRHSSEADDTPEGMAEVVGPRGWRSREDAARLFKHMVNGERHLAETLW
jgi:hypothetical protein